MARNLRGTERNPGRPRRSRWGSTCGGTQPRLARLAVVARALTERRRNGSKVHALDTSCVNRLLRSKAVTFSLVPTSLASSSKVKIADTRNGLWTADYVWAGDLTPCSSCPRRAVAASDIVRSRATYRIRTPRDRGQSRCSCHTPTGRRRDIVGRAGSAKRCTCWWASPLS